MDGAADTARSMGGDPAREPEQQQEGPLGPAGPTAEVSPQPPPAASPAGAAAQAAVRTGTAAAQEEEAVPQLTSPSPRSDPGALTAAPTAEAFASASGTTPAAADELVSSDADAWHQLPPPPANLQPATEPPHRPSPREESLQPVTHTPAGEGDRVSTAHEDRSRSPPPLAHPSHPASGVTNEQLATKPAEPSVPTAPVELGCSASAAAVAAASPQSSGGASMAASAEDTGAPASDKPENTPAREGAAAATAAQVPTPTPQALLDLTPSISTGYPCEQCGTVSKVRFATGRFCSRHCSARFSRRKASDRGVHLPDQPVTVRSSSRRKIADVHSDRPGRAAQTSHPSSARKQLDASTTKRCTAVLEALMEKEDAKPFCVRVDPEEYPEYTKFVTEPMDLSIVTTKLRSGAYRTVAPFARDTRLVFKNCLAFNHDRSPICKIAHRLLAMFERLLQNWILTTEPRDPETLDDGVCIVCSTEDLKDHASMLLCDGCDAAYHMGCLSPPLLTVPLTDWFCPTCADNRSPSDKEAASPVRALRSTVSGRTKAERKALDRWLREHVGEPVMMENGSVGVLQGFRFGYCQIDVGGVEPATKSPHEVSLNQAGLEIDYAAKDIAESQTNTQSKKRQSLPSPSALSAQTKPSLPATLSVPSSSATPTLNNRGSGEALSPNTSTLEVRESSTGRPKNSWVCINCLRRNSENARKCCGCSELKGHTAADIATLNKTGHQEMTREDRDIPAFLLARFATAIGFDKRMMTHKGTHDHAFCANPNVSGQSASPKVGASRRIKSARINKCGHPERRHHAKGLCLKCYRTDLAKRKESEGQTFAHETAQLSASDAALSYDAPTLAASAATLDGADRSSAADLERPGNGHLYGNDASISSRREQPIDVAIRSVNAGENRQVSGNEGIRTSTVGSCPSNATYSDLSFHGVVSPSSNGVISSADSGPLQPLEMLQIKTETICEDPPMPLQDTTGPLGNATSMQLDSASKPNRSNKPDTMEITTMDVKPRITRRSVQALTASNSPVDNSSPDDAEDDAEILPERPDRLLCMYNHLKANGMLDGTIAVSGREATPEELLSVHSAEYIQMVLDLADNDIAKDTPVAAKIAAAVTTDTVSAVVMGHHDGGQTRDLVQNGMAFVRPPGHHAGPNTAQGWCYFNNIAIAARAAQKKHDVRRVLIIDWDVHHGNGTEEVFYEDASVLTVSLHRKAKDFYPESGSPSEVGSGAGLGFNCNIAWSREGMGDAEYIMAFSRVVLPLAHEFNPDLVLVSAGFDAGVADPLGGCCVTPAGFAHLTSMLMGLAGAKLVLVCEGGYNLRTISRAAAACLRVLRGEMPPQIARKLKPKQSAAFDLLRTEMALSPHWSSLYRMSTFSPYALSLATVTDSVSKRDGATVEVATSSEDLPPGVSPPPYGTSLLSKEGLNNLLQTGKLLHQKISVWWKGDKRWYTGSIHHVDSRRSTFVIHYDDSEVVTETIDAVVALHVAGGEIPTNSAATAAAAASADVRPELSLSYANVDAPCPCPGAPRRERVKQWVQMNTGKTVRFFDGREAVLLAPGRGYVKLMLHGASLPSYARTRDLQVPPWVLQEHFNPAAAAVAAVAAAADPSRSHNARARRGHVRGKYDQADLAQNKSARGMSRSRGKHRSKSISEVMSAEEISDEEDSDDSDGSDCSEEPDDDDGKRQLNTRRYIRWLHGAVGTQVSFRDGRRGTLVRSGAGFIEIVLKREGVVRVRRRDIILPRSVYEHEADEDSGGAGSEEDEEADSDDDVSAESSDEDSADEDSDDDEDSESDDEDGDGGKKINTYR